MAGETGTGEAREDVCDAIGGRTLVEGIILLLLADADERRLLFLLPYLDKIGILFFLRDLFGFCTVSGIGDFSFNSVCCKDNQKF